MNQIIISMMQIEIMRKNIDLVIIILHLLDG